MTQKHNTHVRTLPPTNHSTTTNHEEKRIDSTDCPAATGRNCPAPFHQRGREKDGKGKDGNERLPAGSPRNHPRQIRISDHHGCRTFRSTQCPRQRDGQRIAQRSLQSRDRPLRRRPNQDAGCLHPAFPDKRTDQSPPDKCVFPSPSMPTAHRTSNTSPTGRSSPSKWAMYGM